MFTKMFTHASCTVKEKKSTDNILETFFWIFPENRFRLFLQTVGDKQNIIKLLSVEFALSVVKVKLETIFNLLLFWSQGYTNRLMSIATEAS